MSVSSIGIQTITPKTGTSQQPPPQRPANNDDNETVKQTPPPPGMGKLVNKTA